MTAAESAAAEPADQADVAALIPIVRRIVMSRVGQHPSAEDLVQETLVRVLAAQSRIDPGMLEPYAIVTARNVIASMWRDKDRGERNLHRVVDLRPVPEPDEDLLTAEMQSAVNAALERLSDRERATLLAHEVTGEDTHSLAAKTGSSAGAVAAQLNRTRARLRVEYLLAVEKTEPPSERCRPVLLALSSGDRRRQREVNAASHVLECPLCSRLCQPLMDRGHQRDDELRVPIRTDADVVAARRAVRELAGRLNFSRTDLTLIATAVSEVTRNIVKFAGTGEVVVEIIEANRRGVQVVARDKGQGIADIDKAITDGYSTYDGLGLGLPGARRIMDEFAIISEPGHGTTVTMTKWCRE